MSDVRDSYERERDLRIDLERRFDHRIADGSRAAVMAAARAWTGRSPDAAGNPSRECQAAITDLLILANSLDAENQRLRAEIIGARDVRSDHALT